MRALEQRLVRLFIDDPIPFRRQNDGNYPDKHTLAPHISPAVTEMPAHIATDLTNRPEITEAAPRPSEKKMLVGE
jgi:hypothetical protein